MRVPGSFAETLESRKEEILAAITLPEFYAEITMIFFAFAIAILLAALVRHRTNQYLKHQPFKRFDPELITRALELLGPLLGIIGLGIIKPFVMQYGAGGGWLIAASQLCIAYLIAKAVLLVIPSRGVAWLIAIVVMVMGALDATGFSDTTQEYLDSMAFTVGQFHISMLNLIRGIVMLVVVFWGAGLLSRTLEGYLRRSSSLSYNARELSVKFFRIFIYFVALMITLSAMGVDLTAFAVFGGALGVGIGLGLQRLTSNFVSGITLLIEKSIRIGDLVEIGNISGFVRQLNVRYTLVETPDGRDVMIPNEELMSTRVTNWTHTTTRGRVDVNIGVAYGSDPRQVMKIILDAALAHPRCLKDPEPNCYLREFADNSLNFLLVFWVGDVHEGRFAPQSDVMIDILERFNKAGIEIPFPQRVIHMQKE